MDSLTDVGLSDDVLLWDGNKVNVPLRFSADSSSGIGWGFFGSGPLNLALNILLAAGLEREEAADLHQGFTVEFLGAGSFPHEGGRIAKESIRHWTWLQRVCPHPRWEPHHIEDGARCVACRVHSWERRAREAGDRRKLKLTPWDRM
jgi:hypothetical protein